MRISKPDLAFAGHSDGSGEDDLSPIGNTADRSTLRQFPSHRGRPEWVAQQDMDYSSTTTLWSNSSRYPSYQFSLFYNF